MFMAPRYENTSTTPPVFPGFPHRRELLSCCQQSGSMKEPDYLALSVAKTISRLDDYFSPISFFTVGSIALAQVS